MSIETKFTYKDLRDAPDDLRRYEIIEGDLLVSPSPKTDHQIAVTNLLKIISGYADRYEPGRLLAAPTDVYFSDETVVVPDMLFISAERFDIVDEDKVKGAPDVVIEVPSESTRSRDRGIKFNLYAREGVKEYWMADPEEKSIEVYKMDRKESTLIGKFQGDDIVESAYFKELEYKTSDAWK